MAQLPARQTFFVTGTDTNVGKTLVSSILLARAAAAGHACFAIKPISAGCVQDAKGEWQSEDANQLKKYASVELIDELVAPIKLPVAASPHIAASAQGERLQSSRIVGHVRAGLSTRASHVLVEGAGGWRVPINAQECLSDVAKQLRLPVIVVVGIRLGCLNHALLTVESIIQDGLSIAGWVANCVDPHAEYVQEQIDTLKKRISSPCLGVLPHQRYIDPSQLIDLLRWPNEISTDPLQGQAPKRAV
jgi:dethiobiotin synthetase